MSKEAVKQETSEERQRKYWNLSAFYNHVKWIEQNDPGTCIADIINSYLDNQEYEAEAWREMADYEHEVWRHNQRILRAIKSVKGKTFYKYFLEIIKSCDRVKDVFEIVSEPCGVWTEEKYGRTIGGVWVDQWSVGMEGDSFEGYVWVQLKENKFLKISYSM
jgi:hypothetical protein